MKALLTTLVLAGAAAAATASPITFNPEVDADAPGRIPIDSAASLPTVTLASRPTDRFDPEVDSDRVPIAPTVVIPNAVVRSGGSFNPEVDADRHT